MYSPIIFHKISWHKRLLSDKRSAATCRIISSTLKLINRSVELTWAARCQRLNHVFKVGGPVPWSRVLLPFYGKKVDRSTEFDAIGYIITLFIKKLRENLRVRPNCGGQDPSDPSGCAHARCALSQRIESTYYDFLTIYYDLKLSHRLRDTKSRSRTSATSLSLRSKKSSCVCKDVFFWRKNVYK